MNRHGNLNLHVIVDRYREVYQTSTRKEKAAITRHIVQELKTAGSRFIRRLDDDSDDKWVEVDDKTAYKKVGHALRLKKSNHGQNFLMSVVHRQPVDSQHSLTLHSTSPGETSTSRHVAAMPSGLHNTLSHPSRLPSSSSLTMHFRLPSAVNQHQMATQSAPWPETGTQHQPTLHPSVVSGYGIGGIDPQIFADAFAITLATMTQLQHQQRSTFNGSFMDGQNYRRSYDEGR
jgi:hypothetical protein